jgi:serine/threonine protein kinase
VLRAAEVEAILAREATMNLNLCPQHSTSTASEATEAADIWAFGLLILELITKEAPYSECGCPPPANIKIAGPISIAGGSFQGSLSGSLSRNQSSGRLTSSLSGSSGSLRSFSQPYSSGTVSSGYSGEAAAEAVRRKVLRGELPLAFHRLRDGEAKRIISLCLRRLPSERPTAASLL